MVKNQLAHVEEEVREIREACKELHVIFSCLAEGEAGINRLQELIPKDEPVKRLIFCNEILDSAIIGSEDSGDY